MILKYYELLTDLENSEIKDVHDALENNTCNPRDLKLRLAHIITEEYHGKENADKAQEGLINVVSNKGIPEDIQEVKVEQGKNILDLITELKFTASRGEAKRLIQGGGVKIDGEKITDMGYTISFEESVVLQAGKRKFAKLVK